MAIAMWLLSRRRHGYCIVVVIETDCNVVVIETAYYAVSMGGLIDCYDINGLLGFQNPGLGDGEADA